MTAIEQAKVVALTAPLYVAWEITRLCNAQCVHCYSDSGPTVNRAGELSTDEALRVIDELADASVMVLAFSGGEPILRKDWLSLVRHAIGEGLSVNIGSNGSTISEEVACQLAEVGVRSVTVSLDSDVAESHDRFRRLPGLFAKATNAITRLARHGLRVVVGFTPTKLNWRDGPGVVRLAFELGASAANLSEYVPAGRGTLDLSLSPDDLHKVLCEWIQLREEYRGRVDVIWHDCRVGMLVPDSERRQYVGCGAGRFVARICANGDVTPCVFLPTVIGSLKRNTFSEIWGRSELLQKFRERQGHVHGNCGECAHLATCGGCRAVAHAYSAGDVFAGDPHCWIERAPSDRLVRMLVEGESVPA